MIQNNLEWWTSLSTSKEYEVGEEWKGGGLYEKLLKLTNNFQNMTIDSFLTTVFIFGLQPYLCVATTCMKRKTLE
jgi:hypothetical protein